MKYDLKDTYIVRFNQKETEIAMTTNNLQVFYGNKQAFFDGNMQFPKNRITALIGASGSGKSTFLRSLNRMNDDVARVEGQIMYRGIDVNSRNINVYEMRKHVGMVFQRPNPFSKSIRDNITFALKEKGLKDKVEQDRIVEESLKGAALWDEVKDDLDKSALALSGGQQQRLCIARAIAMKPDILLMDEPCSALDPISTLKVEETMLKLKERYTIIIVTHNMQQASRVSDYTAFFHMGHVIEYDKTKHIFTNSAIKATEDYVSGNFG
ncbi:phosphate ABC transporter ATP-binding protein PstB [Ligilactobacillus ruminis]|uniref:phosphate ABC transporter ATP-binding protein PstB n=1 Tax=Ligilactobacillus ruminis TaxID=1623 RepID=UPI0022E01853|nr:phosphate ABC transporter ATP-binding protein PstB [Ligilactobacillus ruminis]